MNNFVIREEVQNGNFVLNKTWQEILDASNSGKFVYVITAESDWDAALNGSGCKVLVLNRIFSEIGGYIVEFSDNIVANSRQYTSNEPNDYPTFNGGDE